MLCLCGCGRVTAITKNTRAERGQIAGQHVSYIRGHVRRKHPHGYEVRDCGYKTPCWVWGSCGPHGYGMIWDSDQQKLRTAYGFFYEKKNGKPKNGLQLDHLCRNKPCVNPDHLEEVTQTVNVRRGAQTKLTEEKVVEIRALSGSGIINAEIARRYEISKTHVSRVLLGESWAN